MASQGDIERIMRDDSFLALTRERARLSWTLSFVMLAVFLVFLFLVAFGGDLLAMRVAGATSMGIVLGVAVIVFAFILTGVYVSRANARFDALTDSLKRRFA